MNLLASFSQLVPCSAAHAHPLTHSLPNSTHKHVLSCLQRQGGLMPMNSASLTASGSTTGGYSKGAGKGMGAQAVKRQLVGNAAGGGSVKYGASGPSNNSKVRGGAHGCVCECLFTGPAFNVPLLRNHFLPAVLSCVCEKLNCSFLCTRRSPATWWGSRRRWPASSWGVHSPARTRQ